MIAGLPAPDLAWLAAAAFVAGLVRGFSGFGTAMIYLPVAGQVLNPFAAITTLLVMDVVAPLPKLPGAWREGSPGDILRLFAGLVVVMPVGLWTLTRVEPEVFRYVVSVVALVLLAALVTGLRFRGRLTRPMVFGTGGLSGYLMGVAGLPGPPVILLYMASALPAHVIRANIFVYLVLTDLAMLPMLAAFGRLETGAVVAGALMILPNMAGIFAGARLFVPGRERVYRGVAYAVIAVSALSGLPVWD